MPYDIDNANPTDSSKIADFPANERDSRTATEGSLDVEHDYNSGTGEMFHKFGIGDDTDRDTINTWVAGAIWFNDGIETGKVFLEVCTVGSPTETWVTTDLDILDVENQWTKAQVGEYVPLIDGASVASDWGDGNFFELTTTQDFTLANPTLAALGGDEAQSAVYVITQGAGAPWEITFGTMFRGAYGTKPVLSTTVGLVDVIYCTLLPGNTHIAVTALLGVDLS